MPYAAGKGTVGTVRRAFTLTQLGLLEVLEPAAPAGKHRTSTVYQPDAQQCGCP